MKFSITTLGCKVNQYESAAVHAALQRADLPQPAEPVRRGEQADLVVINTCCVTATAMRKCRQAIRRAVRTSPGAAVLVMGCYSDYDAAALRRLLCQLGVPSSRTVLAAHQSDVSAGLQTLLELLRWDGQSGPAAPSGRSGTRAGTQQDATSTASGLRACGSASPPNYIKTQGPPVKANSPGTKTLGAIEKFPGHCRAFVKVQDGCDAFCAYCVVPFTRRNVWSRSLEEVVAECRALAAAGHKEIVLCGVFLGAFGRATALRRRWSDGPGQLPELVRRVAGIDGLWRVRLSSLEPGDITSRLVEACRGLDNFAPHFHLPLQSGSQRILRRMNRQYDADHYRRAVARIKQAFDRPAITTDVIVGYPGESDDDFAQTLAVADEAGFAKIHVFRFSPIRGTAARSYRDESPPRSVVQARIDRLGRLERKLAREYREQFLGDVIESLVVASRSRRTNRAITDRYLTVEFASPAGRPGPQPGQIVDLAIDRLSEDGLSGTLRGSH